MSRATGHLLYQAGQRASDLVALVRIGSEQRGALVGGLDHEAPGAWEFGSELERKMLLDALSRGSAIGAVQDDRRFIGESELGGNFHESGGVERRWHIGGSDHQDAV